MSLFSTTTGTDATSTDAGIDVNAIFDGLLTVFGFFRKIIDFLKGIFTPILKELFSSLGDKVEEALDE